MSALNFIDLFSGAGGLSCGMEMSGMHCLLGVEMDTSAAQTFSLNHKRAKTFCDLIQKLTRKKLRDLLEGQEIHAVVGGPPCQGFSTVGPGDPLDQRNSLFLEFVRIVKETSPYFIVLENVTGLVAKKNDHILKSIFKRFERIGYNMDVQVMSAQHYGVPEKRRRTVIIGTRINSAVRFPKQTHKVPITVGEVLKDLRAADGKIYNHDKSKALPASPETIERLKYIPEGKGIRYERDEKKYLPTKLSLGVNWSEMAENRFRQAKYLRLDRSAPSPTILTQRDLYYHPTENRYLTLREAAKIQSFPNNFIFEGSLTSQWRQIGNAVPPLLGKAIGKALLRLYREAKKDGALENLHQKSVSSKIKANKIHKIRSEAFHYSDL